MSYIKIGLTLFFISSVLLFMGLFLVDGFFITGFVVHGIGIGLMVIGVAKRDGLLH